MASLEASSALAQDAAETPSDADAPSAADEEGPLEQAAPGQALVSSPDSRTRQRIRLSWRAPAGCNTQAELEEATERVLGTEVFSSEASMEIRGHVSGRPGRWSATLELRDLSGQAIGQREIEVDAPTCQGLLQPLQLVIALAVDRLRDEDNTQISLPPGPPAAAPSADESTPWGAELLLLTEASVGMLPEPTLGAGIAGVLHIPDFLPLHLELSFWVPQSRVDADGRGGSFWGLSATLSGCPALLEGGMLGLDLCAGLMGARVAGEGLGLSRNQSNEGYLLSGRLMMVFRLTLAETWVLRLGGGAQGQIYKDTFYFEGRENSRVTVHDPPWVVPWAQLSLGIRIP